MQAVKSVAESDRDALIKGIAVELGQHEVVGPGLLHRIISEVQGRYVVTGGRDGLKTVAWRGAPHGRCDRFGSVLGRWYEVWAA